MPRFGEPIDEDHGLPYLAEPELSTSGDVADLTVPESRFAFYP